MLTLQDGRPFAHRVLVGVGDWRCPACGFSRTYSTRQGALHGASVHMMDRHRVRLMLPPTSTTDALDALAARPAANETRAAEMGGPKEEDRVDDDR